MEKEEKIISEEEIYREYWKIDEKQTELEEELEKETEEMKEKAKKFGLDLEKTPAAPEGIRFKLFERSREIEEMKNPLKEKILKEFEETDPEAPERMVKELREGELKRIEEEIKKRREEIEEITKKEKPKYREVLYARDLELGIRGFERRKEKIKGIIEDFENQNPDPLKNFVEEELKGILEDKWRGEEGFERLKRAIFLKKVFNTLERK